MILSVYEEQVKKQLTRWELQLLKRSGPLERVSKKVQERLNKLIPDKIHQTVTAAMRAIFQTTLQGIDYIPKNEPLQGPGLAQSDIRAEELISFYKKLASVEGAGTGAGGILLGLADFPILIGIKLKFLFELAHAYGYSTHDYRERLFILYVFQLAFTSPAKKKPLLETIRNWHEASGSLLPVDSSANLIDWQQLQQEYRDTIDFRKMLQLVPGIGAVVGAWANYELLEELGEVAMNCYRLRRLKEKEIGMLK